MNCWSCETLLLYCWWDNGLCWFALLTYLLHWAESFSKKLPVLSWSRNSRHFMEPEGSLPHSQVPATCPYSEPDRSSPYPTSHFRHIHLNIILLSTSWSPKWSLSLRLTHQTLYTALLSPIRAICPAHHNILHCTTQTILDEDYRLLISSLCNFLHSPVTSSLLGPNTLLNTPFSNTLSLRFSLNMSDQVSHSY